MPVVVGLIIATMAIVTFSTWFLNFSSGMKELVLDDAYYTYRMIVACLACVVFAVGVFGVIATVNECPNQTREGIFAGLRCDSYLRLKASADGLFQPKNEAVNETL